MRMCLPVTFDRLAGKQRLVDMQELARDLVALGVVEEEAVALVLDRIAAGDDVDQQAAVGEPVERRGHARGDASAAAGRGARRPGSAAARSAAPAPRRRPRNPRSSCRSAAARRNSRAGRPPARSGGDRRGRWRGRLRGAEVAAVAMGRQEPEDVDALGESAVAFMTAASARRRRS